MAANKEDKKHTNKESIDDSTAPVEAAAMKIIARIHTGFTTKFGVPRQSGLVEALKGKIIFEPEYRNAEALRGLEEFSHLWLIWQFSEAVRDNWSPTVRPPRLGGNKRIGVFATRSPFRPNALGLSCVRLESIDLHTPLGPVINVSGIDMMDNTPIFDIKPYIPYADCKTEAQGGFVEKLENKELQVEFPKEMLSQIPKEHREAILGALAEDPRPSYQKDPERIYGLSFAGFDVRFTVRDRLLSVCQVIKL